MALSESRCCYIALHKAQNCPGASAAWGQRSGSRWESGAPWCLDNRGRKKACLFGSNAERAAELVALQPIRSRGEEIPGVGIVVPQELKQIPAKGIGSRLHDRADL